MWGSIVLVDGVKDILQKLVDCGQKFGAEFVDVRFEEVKSLNVRLVDGIPKIGYGVDRGVAIRVYYSGAIGFAYTSRLDWDNLRKTLERAFVLARASVGVSRAAKPIELKAVEDDVVWPLKRDPANVGLEEKLADVREVDKILGSERFVKSRTVGYSESSVAKVYASSEGRLVSEKRTLVLVVAEAYAEEAGVRASAYKSNGSIKGYVVWEKMSPEKLANTVLDRLRKQLRAKTPKAGEFPVVLAPEAVGVFVHEAFGHLAEADLVAAGSVLKGKVGEKVASSKVTIVDDPTIDDGFGTFKYDDEGVRTTKAVIVEKGVLKGYMTDRLYASLLNIEPTGNGRAESYRVPPLVRMRNTLIEPGTNTVDELFEGISFGYYIVAVSGGQTNLDGGFQVGVGEAYEIVNGEVRDPVRNMSISGNTLDTLLNVDAVANDLQIFYGHCGKGQLVPVSDGGPHIRVKKMTVGGRA